jgi:protein TonB
MQFEYIAREVEPKPYPGFKVQDFVEYPGLAKEAGIEGRVIIAAFINKKGLPKNCYLVKGVFESLDNMALQAVQKSRWIPAKQQGKRIGVWVNIPVSFKLQ